MGIQKQPYQKLECWNFATNRWKYLLQKIFTVRYTQFENTNFNFMGPIWEGFIESASLS